MCVTPVTVTALDIASYKSRHLADERELVICRKWDNNFRVYYCTSFETVEHGG